MKTNSLIAGLLCAFLCSATADYPQKPLKTPDIHGSWVGYETGGADFFRLNLRKPNTGEFVLLYPEGRPAVYNITWLLEDGTLSLRLAPKNTAVEPINCSVIGLDYRHMIIVISGASTNQWSRRATLYNEKVLERKLSESARYGRH